MSVFIADCEKERRHVSQVVLIREKVVGMTSRVV